MCLEAQTPLDPWQRESGMFIIIMKVGFQIKPACFFRRAFQRFYQKFIETAYPIEDIYIEWVVVLQYIIYNITSCKYIKVIIK